MARREREPRGPPEPAAEPAIVNSVLERAAGRLFPDHAALKTRRSEAAAAKVAAAPLKPDGKGTPVSPAAQFSGLAAPPPVEFVSNDAEISSSLPLQVLLYFNAWLYGAWAVLMAATVGWRLGWFGLSTTAYIVDLAVFAALLLLEPVRLWWGYSGNLRESVPSLTGHIMLSVILCVPACVYFCGLQALLPYGFSMPLQVAINAVYLALVAPQIYFAYVGASRIVRLQAAAFYLQLTAQGFSDELSDFENAAPKPLASESTLVGASHDWLSGSRPNLVERSAVLSPANVSAASPLGESNRQP